MILRPADETGDILPVLSSADLLSDPEAVARLVQYRLSLLQGEWWETPGEGFFILEEMRESRITEADGTVLSSRITAYIRETPAVRDVEKVQFSVFGRQFSYACDIRTEEGSAGVSYGADL